MKTTYQNNTYHNVSHNERAFRSVFGMGLLTTVAAGAFAVPTVIFGASMIGVYLVMTAIIGSDPVYAVAQAISSTSGIKGDRLATTYSI